MPYKLAYCENRLLGETSSLIFLLSISAHTNFHTARFFISMRVPQFDLTNQIEQIQAEILTAIKNVMSHRQFILGPEVEALEKDLSGYCDARHAVGVSSGTDALLLALMAIDISPGDEIITTPFTFFATAGVIVRLGARPVFVDIESESFNLDAAKVGNAISEKTKAIIPVHLFGRCVSMKPLLRIAKENDLHIVEDAAQALGARTEQGMAGTIGDAGCYSFFPTKNLGAFGDAGMVVTQDEKLFARLKKLRVHGSTEKYKYEEVGGNFRLDTLQAAILQVKLKYLDEWTENRKAHAHTYDSLFESSGISIEKIVPPEIPGENHVFHQYVIRARERDSLRKYLKERDVQTGVYYPLPLHLQPCFQSLGYNQGDFPESEKASNEVLALPMYPELSKEAQEYVVQTILGFYN